MYIKTNSVESKIVKYWQFHMVQQVTLNTDWQESNRKFLQKCSQR